ncbi:alpha-mannosidase [Granulicella paludicola]|uniref:alpha-mannosidase n=1 Tax=Granulicella paludicola TaxID=474951 RepID=UPI0021DFDBCF|nr:alpha-mannosidase [Granulicella paludicola]
MYLSRARMFSVLMASVAYTAISTAQTAAAPDLTKEPTLYAVGYAHLDTEWRWEYPQVIDEYLYRTMHDNFNLFEKYPHYIFNFSGANRYRLMEEYYPSDFNRVKHYVAEGRWFPAGSSMEEGDVNAPNAEAVIRQILYGNKWFLKTFGKASEEYMLPDCFGFPSSLPSILAHSGVKGFSTQKLSWGSSANVGGPESLENTPEGTPFNVGVWVGPDGSRVIAAFNPGAYNGDITTDLSTPLPPMQLNPLLPEIEKKLSAVDVQRQNSSQGQIDPGMVQQYFALRQEQSALEHQRQLDEARHFQGDWAARVLNNGKVTGLFADYHYYGTGDIGGAPREESVKRLEAIITKGSVDMPPADGSGMRSGRQGGWPMVTVGNGPVHVVSATADQMFKDITPAEAAALPRYTGELELTNHSAGSLTSQAYQKRWIRTEELLADAAEKSSLAAAWLGGRSYPLERLNDAWTLAMAAHFHDLAAGTATPRSYDFAWNDDVIAMNQFSVVLKSATDAVSQALDTQTKGIPVVVFNQLNVPREDIVEASLDFNGKSPSTVRVTGPDGNVVPSQRVKDKLIFNAKVPSIGYAVYDVEPADNEAAASSDLRVTDHELENAYYRVTLNGDGDVASIFDKQLNKELLSAPARLALSYDNPEQWPAWNMDWTQEQAAPKEYVSGPAKIRIAEKGPVRVAIEVTRETGGSRFMQTISLASGQAGKRVEFGNVIDWNTRERNLKATFPLVAENENATYNWDIGTIDRPTAQPKKFEVPSHQWIDLTDMSGKFGATVLTDAKNGSDKPDDHTIRLTLIRTPGVAGGYTDQATQDIGHHEFKYGFAGHADGWRDAQTDWQGQELNAPLLSFAATKHAGSLGKSFSIVKINNPRVRILGMKKAEDSDEIIVRLVELDGKPQKDVRVTFAAPVTSAREVNGQEQPLGEAHTEAGELVTSLGAYQPRAFALKLGPAPSTVTAVQSIPVALKYDVATATSDGSAEKIGFDGKGNSLPAEMLPAQVTFNDVVFHLAAAKTNTPNAVITRGQKIQLPAGSYNRVYLLAASSSGDQSAEFEAGDRKTKLNIENWGGFVGQWDERVWSSADTSQGYGEMVGLKPGFIKRADLAWYSSHHHNAAGKNVAYSYSYLFAYGIDLPAGARTLTLPKNPNVRILAISVANEDTEAKPLEPLYDVLPSPNAGAPDFSLSTSGKVAVSQGRSATTRIVVLPRGNFDGGAKLTAIDLPAGVTAKFSSESAAPQTLTISAAETAAPTISDFRVIATSGSIKHEETIHLNVTPILKGTVPVDLSSAFNVNGIYKKGTKFEPNASADGGGYSFATETLGREQVGGEVIFKLGPANVADAVSSKTISLPAGKYSSIHVLATAIEGNQTRQPFTISYTDGTTSTATQSLSDWSGSAGFRGESDATDVPYRIAGDGTVDGNPFHLWAYEWKTDPAKEVKSLTLPSNRNVIVFGVTLVPAGN